MVRIGPVLRALGTAAVLVGCAETYWTSNIRETMGLPAGSAIATNADVRLVHRFQGYDPDTEWVVDEKTGAVHPTRPPRDFLCAEPSPDIARVVQAALTTAASGAASVTPPTGGTGVDAQAAFNLAAARTEGIAQLTKRIATVQLLRDGLYRACEAYANGAIGQEIYTAIISRYDRMMVTMLLGEMAAGNFGSAALLSGDSTAGPAAGTQAEADTRVTTATTARDNADASLKTEEAKLPALRNARDTAQTNLETATNAGTNVEQARRAADTATQNLNDQIAAVERSKHALADAERELRAARLARAAIAGTASTSSSGQVVNAAPPPQHPQVQVADTLARMQRTYLNEPQGNALLLMCFSEMAKPENIRKAMRRTCEALFASLATPARQGLIWDTTARQQLRELDNDRVRALASRLTPEAASAALKQLQQGKDEPTGLPARPR